MTQVKASAPAAVVMGNIKTASSWSAGVGCASWWTLSHFQLILSCWIRSSPSGNSEALERWKKDLWGKSRRQPLSLLAARCRSTEVEYFRVNATGIRRAGAPRGWWMLDPNASWQRTAHRATSPFIHSGFSFCVFLWIRLIRHLHNSPTDIHLAPDKWLRLTAEV